MIGDQKDNFRLIAPELPLEIDPGLLQREHASGIFFRDSIKKQTSKNIQIS